MENVKKAVVQGEAPESDNDSEETETPVRLRSDLKHGQVVDGEAPESDEDIVSFCKEAVTDSNNGEGVFKKEWETYHRKHESILQRKLGESNTALWKDLTRFIQNTVLSNSKQLLSADQMLLRSQVSLQTASHNLKVANTTSKHMLEKTRDVVTSYFIPSIKI